MRYPQVVDRPTAIEQTAEKTAGGGVKLDVDPTEVDAKTLSSAGDLSWQAAKWSTPDALELWMTLAAQAYARATETEAGAALVAGVTATEAVDADDLAGWLAAVTTATATIQLGSDFIADAVYADPTSAAHLAALVLAESPTGPAQIGGMELVSSNGLAASAPIVIVGYSQAVLVAETPDAPIQLRALEPAIGGVEVGVIGAFAADVSDAAAFVKLTGP